MSMKLYVGNLSFETSSNELQTLFAQTGTVESVSLIEDRETGRSRGFGFIEMSTKEEGAAAIQKFNGQELGGRALKVNEAKPRESRLALSDKSKIGKSEEVSGINQARDLFNSVRLVAARSTKSIGRNALSDYGSRNLINQVTERIVDV